MSAKCSGINYVLELRERSVMVRPRPFQARSVTIEIGEIRSVELLRKSVMPPAVIGLIGLSLTLIFRLPDIAFIGSLPFALLTFLQSITLGIAVFCLAVLSVRWFFCNLVLKPAKMPPIVVRMVPSSSARRLVMLFQMQAPLFHDA